LDLLDEMPRPEVIAHPEHNLMPVERLVQEIVSTESEGIVPGHAAFFLGQDDDGRKANAFSGPAEPAQQFQAVRLRHVEVEQHQVGCEVLECLLDLIGVEHGADLVRDVHQHGLEQSDVHRLVIYDQNPVARNASLVLTVSAVQLDSAIVR